MSEVRVSPIPPGEVIREALRSKGWSQDDLAGVLGRSSSSVSQIVTGKQEITAEIAVELEAAFSIPAAEWLRRESEYRLARINTSKSETVEKRKSLYEMGPIKEMQKRNWIKTTNDPQEIESELLKFYGINDLTETPQFSGALRKSSQFDAITSTQRAWMMRVKNLASMHRIPAFRENKIASCMSDLRKLSAFSAAIPRVPALLEKYGIRFVIVEPFPGSKIDGFATWIGKDSPVIGMTIRYDRIDNFWHTLVHEVVHLKYRDDAHIDAEDEEAVDTSEIEIRANKEASDLFIPQEEIELFVHRYGPVYSKSEINKFANRFKVHPGIIAGKIQRYENNYSILRDLLVKVRSSIIKTALTDGWGVTLT